MSNQTVDIIRHYLERLQQHYLRKSMALEASGDTSHVGLWGASTGVERAIAVVDAVVQGTALPAEVRDAD